MAFHQSPPPGNDGRTLLPDDALTRLEAAIRQLDASRRQLEACSTPDQGDDDALVYILAAEMQLKAAHRRLERF